MHSSKTSNVSLATNGRCSWTEDNPTSAASLHPLLSKALLSNQRVAAEARDDQNPHVGLARAEVRPTEFACLHGERAAFHLSDGNETRRQHNASTYFLHFTRMPVCPMSKPATLPPPKRHIPHLCGDV